MPLTCYHLCLPLPKYIVLHLLSQPMRLPESTYLCCSSLRTTYHPLPSNQPSFCLAPFPRPFRVASLKSHLPGTLDRQL
jgi:hypothetical protein